MYKGLVLKMFCFHDIPHGAGARWRLSVCSHRLHSWWLRFPLSDLKN